MKKLFIILAVVILLSALVISGCAQPAPAPAPAPTPTPAPAPAAQPKTLKVGTVYSLSGSGSAQALAWRDAALLAKDWVNQKGGITVNGEKYLLDLVVEDSTATPPGVINACTKLIELDKVKFITGEAVTVFVEAASQIANKNNVLYVAQGNSHIYPDYPYTFVSSFIWISVIPHLYDITLEKYPAVKTIGYIVEDEAGARVIGEISQNAAKSHGLTVLEPVFHPWGSNEFYPQWTKIMTQNPDAVALGLVLPQLGANCVKQGRELGYKGPIFCITPIGSPTMLGMIGEEYATDFISPSYDPYGPEAPPMAKEVVKFWHETYDYKIGAYDYFDAFDTVYCLSQAIEKAQSLDPTDVRDSWQKMATLETVKGTAKMGGAKTYGINNVVFSPLPLGRFQDGKIEFLKWVDPWVP